MIFNMNVVGYAFRDSFVISLIFYILSNLWVFLEGLLYPPTLSGFIQCYIMAIPFFFNKLSIIAFLGSLFIRVAKKNFTNQ